MFIKNLIHHSTGVLQKVIFDKIYYKIRCNISIFIKRTWKLFHLSQKNLSLLKSVEKISMKYKPMIKTQSSSAV